MRQPPFLQKVSDEMMRRHYAKRTIQTYIHWISRFILFHQKRHPETMGDAEVEAFLGHLVLQREVAGGTQALVVGIIRCQMKRIVHLMSALVLFQFDIVG